jgi:hypothetical protein
MDSTRLIAIKLALEERDFKRPRQTSRGKGHQLNRRPIRLFLTTGRSKRASAPRTTPYLPTWPGEKRRRRAVGAEKILPRQAEIEHRGTYHADSVADLLPGGYPVDPYFPASGQTSSYGPGDDGDIEPGKTLAYIDNGDGTISDKATGLMWEKKVAYTGLTTNCTNEIGTCGNPHHAGNSYRWTLNAPPYTARQ